MTRKKRGWLWAATTAAVLLLALCLAAQTQGAALRRGSTGSTVSQLQTKLRSMGYYSGNIDGIYGSATETAVRNFQRAGGLTVDGIAGARYLRRRRGGRDRQRGGAARAAHLRRGARRAL